MIRATLRLGVLLWTAAALAALPLGRGAWLGVLVGGSLGLANFWGLARIVGAVLRSRGRRAGVLGALLVAKFALLCALLFAAVRWSGAAPVALAAGISIVVVAMLATSLRHALEAA